KAAAHSRADHPLCYCLYTLPTNSSCRRSARSALERKPTDDDQTPVRARHSRLRRGRQHARWRCRAGGARPRRPGRGSLPSQGQATIRIHQGGAPAGAAVPAVRRHPRLRRAAEGAHCPAQGTHGQDRSRRRRLGHDAVPVPGPEGRV
ncbi:MAG: hypothetical protein ACK55Z_33325, partial [bacterium]